MAFYEGDRVRVVDASELTDLEEGSCGSVIERSGFYWRVVIDGYDYEAADLYPYHLFYEDEIEKLGD